MLILSMLLPAAMADTPLSAQGWTNTELAGYFDTCIVNSGPEPTAREQITCGCVVRAGGALLPREVAQNPDQTIPMPPETEEQFQQALMACLTTPVTQNLLDETLMFRYALDLGVLVRPVTETGWTGARQTEAYEGCLSTRGTRRESSCRCEVFSLARTIPWEQRESAEEPWASVRQQVRGPCLEDVEGSPPFVVPWRR